MRPVSFSYAPSILSANGIALTQTPVAAGALTLNGALVTAGVATMGNQQRITITPAGNETGKTFVLTGTNRNGNAITESLAGTNATLFSSTKNFYTLTSATISAAAAGAMTIGVSGLGESGPILPDIYISPYNVNVAVTAVTGATYKMQYTFDDVQADTWPNGTQIWNDSATMTGKAAVFQVTLTDPARAVRIAITTAGNPQSLSGVVTQAG